MTFYIIFSAFWLGVLTAISPCPLASNIAAISFIGRQVGNKKKVLFSGILYATGRSLVYIALGAAIASGLAASGEISRFLQKYMNELLGPLLILLGMLLVGLIGSSISLSIPSAENIKRKAEKYGIWTALPVGMVFALSFCPVSAGLFFGALVPLSVKSESILTVPSVYGIGTALPVIFFSFLIAFAGEYLGKAFNCLTKIELWFRYTAGVLFILAGIYYCLSHIYGLNFTAK